MTRVTVTGGAAAFPVRDFLTRANVPFEYLDDAGPAGVVVCTLADGTCLDSPTLTELATHLGLVSDPSLAAYDLAVIGAGPAGLAAAVYAASEGLTTVVAERGAPGGQAGTSSQIENYLGFPDGISGADLAARARDQAARFGADMLLLREVVGGGPDEGAGFRVELTGGISIRASTVLCATGVEWRKLQVPGIERLLHSGVYYGSAVSEGPGLRGKDVYVIGGGNSAGQAVMSFARVARSVTLLVRGPHLAASMSAYLAKRLHDAPNVEVRTNAEVSAVDGDDWLRTLELTDSATERRTVVDAHALFVCIGGEPRTEWAADGGIVRDQAGYLVTGRTLVDTDSGLAEGRWSLNRDPYPLETSQPGLFAAGDVRHGSSKRVSAAVGEGAMAVGLVHRFLADLMGS